MSTAGSPQAEMRQIVSSDGAVLAVRPIGISDIERMARTFGRLSRESVHFRFFSPIRELPRATLLRLADVDHRRREALVALDGDEIVAIARYNEVPDDVREAEIAIIVEDAWQHRGVGRQLTRALGVLAFARGYDTFTARILPENRAALALMRKLAPDVTVTFSGGDYEARLPLARTRRRLTAGAQPEISPGS